ncbi:hypothetical protein [Vibrio chagasii]|uniref:hypothetical protein n=1 Tax=Vibrio chagasii TaxID=170679 RepID=UPI00148D83BA|nr:hypothetical protein [Vibrio chagasii]
MFWITFAICFVLGGARQASTKAFQKTEGAKKLYFLTANVVFSAFIAWLVTAIFG